MEKVPQERDQLFSRAVVSEFPLNKVGVVCHWPLPRLSAVPHRCPDLEPVRVRSALFALPLHSLDLFRIRAELPRAAPELYVQKSGLFEPIGDVPHHYVGRLRERRHADVPLHLETDFAADVRDLFISVLLVDDALNFGYETRRNHVVHPPDVGQIEAELAVAPALLRDQPLAEGYDNAVVPKYLRSEARFGIVIHVKRNLFACRHVNQKSAF